MVLAGPLSSETAVEYDSRSRGFKGVQVEETLRRLSIGQYANSEDSPKSTYRLEQASGYRIYFEADSVACYHSFRLAEGPSREALAVWTPIGLLQPTILPFGQKNSGTEAQRSIPIGSKEIKASF